MFNLLSLLVEILTKTTPGTSPGLQFVLKGNHSRFWSVNQSVTLEKSYLQPVVISPPKVRGKKLIISVKKIEIISQLLH